MTDRELMQQALEGLEAAYEGQIWLSHLPDLSTALRERLAQPEQEPVAWLYEAGNDRTLHWYKPLLYGTPLYAAPPQRTWVGLTDEEVSKLIDNEIGFNSCWGPEEQFARAIEAKLKEKNT